MRNRKVAVIDEDKKFLSEIEEILQMGGYDSVGINDAFSAVESVIQHKPHIILVELRMPHKNGFELIDTINRVFETRRIPIIAMSTFFQDEFRRLLDLCGVKRWLKKPFQPLDVIWAIENEAAEADIDLLCNMEDKGQVYPCDRCGYVDCVCTSYRAQNLSQIKD